MKKQNNAIIVTSIIAGVVLIIALVALSIFSNAVPNSKNSVTVQGTSSVKVSPDLKIAKIYISVLEKDKRDSALEKIKSISGFIRSELASRIRIKFVPELKFFIDDTLDYVEKIEGLIKQIHENDNKGNG